MNCPEDIVKEMCHGMILAHPELSWNERYNFITRKEKNVEKVTLISGGGSGHEPAHGGFVGQGMLDGAVCGDIFASPSQVQIYQAIRNIAGNQGVLLIIKNYSGDMMNFKNAAYMAEEDGISVDYIKVDDDIAVQDSLYTVGRRGVAGTVFVHKIAGAAAERGYTLAQVKAVAEKTVKRVKTIGFAFSSCIVPAKGTPTFTLDEKDMEYGIGIHGEPGIRREKALKADELGERMVEELLAELSEIESEQVAVLINGLGGTPLQELYVLNHSVREALQKRNQQVSYDFVGNYMTSIEMQGASVSILKLDEELEMLLTDDCNTPALKITGDIRKSHYYKYSLKKEKKTENSLKDENCILIHDNKLKMENITCIIKRMMECIIENEQKFCQLDAYAGDGDFGMSIAKGFRQLEQEWEELEKICGQGDIGEFIKACGLIIMEYCGGASGPIWGSAFRAAGKAVEGKSCLEKKDVVELLWSAIHGIQQTGERSFGRGAVLGDKTLIDALIPCAEKWSELAKTEVSMKEIFQKAAQASIQGAKSTENIVARMGRAGTVGKRSLGYPDAGAYALGVIFEYISQGIEDSKED